MQSILPMTAFLFAICFSCVRASADDTRRLDFFESRIRPVLSKHCYRCHSVEAEKSKGGLLLDSRTGWQVGGDSGPAIIPLKPEESLIIQAISHGGETSEMPPDGRLPEKVVEDFKTWIADGAVDPRQGQQPTTSESLDVEAGRQFWSFQPRKTTFDQSSIDEFVGPEAATAPPEQLVRRLFLDLIGLPPTPQEHQAFERLYLDQSPAEAVHVFSERLLARKGFGEKWARHWMDVVRYADSNGGDFNLTFPESWRYRNYLIDAFNNDMPYDQFIREQIAGDLLPASGIEEKNRQMVATGFLMVAPKMLTERNKPKMHLDIADEQVDTIGRGILGLTLGCARCHDHKFDPIPTSDYYALLGILHSTRTADGILMGNVNVSGWKETELKVDAQTRKLLTDHATQKTGIEKELKQKKKEQEQLQATGTVVVDDPAAEKTGPWRKSTLRPNHIGAHYLATDKNKGPYSIKWKAQLPRSGEYEVRVSFGGGNGLAKKAPYTVHHAGGETLVIIDQSVKPTINGLWYPIGKFTFSSQQADQTPDPAPDPEAEESVYAEIELSDRDAAGFVIADAIQIVPADTPRGDDANPGDTLLAEIRRLEDRLKTLNANKPEIPKAMVAADHSGERLGDLHIRIRGETRNLGSLAPRGFLQVASRSNAPALSIPADQSGRVQLAQWLTDPDQPLTSRVMVNRIWQQFFGRGIVATTDNFGRRGATPTHPELLDFLAGNFINDGWSVKSLIRKIVRSRTYQQDSQVVSSSDPDNRFLRRQNCRPAAAETIRDSMLAIAGELDRKQQNSAVESLGMYAIETSGKRDPSLARTGDLRQRSIYMPIIRGALPPSLAVFDLPNPDLVTGTRSGTTVPTQALFMLNSKLVQDMSHAMSLRVCSDHQQADPLIMDLYQRILIRRADPDDIANANAYILGLTRDGKTRQQAVASFVQILFSSTEFRFVE